MGTSLEPRGGTPEAVPGFRWSPGGGSPFGHPPYLAEPRSDILNTKDAKNAKQDIEIKFYLILREQ